MMSVCICKKTLVYYLVYNKISQSSYLHTTTVDGINSEANIAEHWQTYFYGIINTINVCNQTIKSSILGTLDDIQHDERLPNCPYDSLLCRCADLNTQT